MAVKPRRKAVVVYVPHGNSAGKNRAMRSLGARLVEYGEDFEEARQEARRWAEAEGHHYVPSFHEWLVEGAGTYSWELFRGVEAIGVAFVPIGMGSGILGMCAARAALGVKTEIVGVVSAHARAYYESFARREVVVSPARTRLADGMAVPAPDARALEVMCAHVSRVAMVNDDQLAAAMRAVFDDTHNVAGGGGDPAGARRVARQAGGGGAFGRKCGSGDVGGGAERVSKPASGTGGRRFESSAPTGRHAARGPQAGTASCAEEASSRPSLSSILAREASSCGCEAWLQKTGLLTHQSMPISLALSTEQITRRICMESNSMSTSLILISPAITTPLSSTRSRTSLRVELCNACVTGWGIMNLLY